MRSYNLSLANRLDFDCQIIHFCIYSDTGGSLVKFLSEGLPSIKTDWSKWKFFFCDERIVSFQDNESTYGQYKANLMEKVPITEDQFVRIDPDLSGKLKPLTCKLLYYSHSVITNKNH